MRYFREFQVEGVMFTDNGFFTPVKGNHVFSSFPCQQVSVFNAGCTTLTSEGLRWQCYPMQELWQGTLNEALGDTFSVEANGCYLVYQTYLPK
jgi:thiamine pyrophosphokinase